MSGSSSKGDKITGGKITGKKITGGIGGGKIIAALSAADLKNTEAAMPNHVHEFSSELSEEYFGTSLRLARYGVHGDGSCGYHSICAALNLNDYVHKSDADQKAIAYEFRCSFASKMNHENLRAIVKKNNGKSPVRLEETQEALCDPKVWADETTLRFVSEALDMNLIFLDMLKNKVYCGMHHDQAFSSKPPATMIVCWINHSHFEPIAHILNVGPRVSEVRIIFNPSESEEDAELVRTLMSRYSKQCDV